MERRPYAKAVRRTTDLSPSPAERQLRQDMRDNPSKYGIRSVRPIAAQSPALDRIQRRQERIRKARDYALDMRIQQMRLEAEVEANRPAPIPLWGWVSVVSKEG